MQFVHNSRNIFQMVFLTFTQINSRNRKCLAFDLQHLTEQIFTWIKLVNLTNNTRFTTNQLHRNTLSNTRSKEQLIIFVRIVLPRISMDQRSIAFFTFFAFLRFFAWPLGSQKIPFQRNFFRLKRLIACQVCLLSTLGPENLIQSS